MAKNDQSPAPEESSDKTEGEAKQGFVKKLLGNRMMLMVIAAALVLVIGGGAGSYFFLFRSAPAQQMTADAAPQIPAVPPQVSFFDVPDILVNVQSADGSPAYLKLSLSLELDADAEKPGIQVLMPRLVDQFQSYLRELRLDDLKGSAGVLRIKEELLRRVNAAAAPYKVRDVLLKEMIIQ